MQENSFNLNFGAELDTINFFNITTNCTDVGEVVFYNFTTFATAMAVLILAWTNTDYKYLFRFKTAFVRPIILFSIVAFIGFTTLLNDFFAQMSFLSYSKRQIILASCLLSIIFYWVIACFIRPSKFHRFNHKKYREAFQKVIVLGRSQEMTSIAEDFALSIQNVVRWSQNRYDNDIAAMPEKVKDAIRIIELMGNEKFAKVVVNNNVSIAQKLFESVNQQKKYNIGLNAFAENFITQALLNEDSFLFDESKLSNGVIGEVKPIISSIYSDYNLIKNIPILLMPHYSLTRTWNSTQVKAYTSILLESIKTSLKEPFSATVFHEPLKILTSSSRNIYKIENRTENLENIREYQVFNEIMWFYKKLYSTLANVDIPRGIPRKTTYSDSWINNDIFDLIAKSIVEIIDYTFFIKGDNLFLIQYTNCWDIVFHSEPLKKSAELLLYRVIRIIKNKVEQDYGIVIFLLRILNIRGLVLDPSIRDFFKLEYILHAWLLNYAKAKLLTAYNAHKTFIDQNIPSSMSIDVQNKELRKIIGNKTQVLNLL